MIFPHHPRTHSSHQWYLSTNVLLIDLTLRCVRFRGKTPVKESACTRSELLFFELLYKDRPADHNRNLTSSSCYLKVETTINLLYSPAQRWYDKINIRFRYNPLTIQCARQHLGDISAPDRSAAIQGYPTHAWQTITAFMVRCCLVSTLILSQFCLKTAMSEYCPSSGIRRSGADRCLPEWSMMEGGNNSGTSFDIIDIGSYRKIVAQML